MDSFMQSMRFAVRSLSRAPALTALVILTLGLGIGATTSVYSVARAALFASPPYPNSDRLALLYERDKVVDEFGNPKEIIHVSANPKYGSEKKGAPTSYLPT